MNLKPENIEFQAKVIEGINKAINKMVIASAEKNEKLVIADKHGNVKVVPAKELLATLSGTAKA